MPLTQQRHYTVGYHDTQKHTHQICEYATDSYEAIEHAKEDVPYLKEHPPLRFVLLDMRLSHTHKSQLYDFDYRDNQPCNVFVALGA